MWSLHQDAPVPLWRAPAPASGATLAFSTRRGGTSDPPFDSLNLGRSTEDRPERVAENRRRLLAALGLDPARLATAGQVHGARITRATAPGHHLRCDALVTRLPGLVLAVTTADCMPLLFDAPGAIAAAHSGWRGTAAGMPRAALDALCEAAGATPDAVTVHLGPCIRACCYRVGPEVAERFPARVVARRDGECHLDLPAAARLQLLEAGLPAESFHDLGQCTACDADRYFSHRRDAGRTGRLWGVAALPD